MAVSLTARGKAKLLRAVGGKRGAARIIDEAAWAAAPTEGARDRIEALFDTEEFAGFLAAWPSKSSVWFDVAVHQLFLAVAAQTPDPVATATASLAVAKRMCELLTSQTFRYAVGRLIARNPDREVLADYVEDFLGLAGASLNLPLKQAEFLAAGGFSTLRATYLPNLPGAYAFFRNKVREILDTGIGADEAERLILLISSEDAAQLAKLAQGKAEALELIFGGLLGRWKSGGAWRDTVAGRLSLERRLSLRAKIPGMTTSEARAGAALLLGRTLPLIPREFEKDLSAFGRQQGFGGRAESTALWMRLAAAPHRWAPELGFFSSEQWIGFSDRVVSLCDSRVLALFVEYFAAAIDRASSLPDSLLSLTTSLLLTEGSVLRDRNFWMLRGKLYATIAEQSMSLRIRERFLGEFALDILDIARGTCDRDGLRLVTTGPREALGASLRAFLDDPALLRMDEEEWNRQCAMFFEKAETLAWAEVEERLGAGRNGEFASLRAVARAFDLDDHALSEIAKIADTELDRYLEPIVFLFRGLSGMDAETGRSLAKERLSHDFWYRLHFKVAYPWIIELVIPIAGSVSILQDGEDSARTDGRSIWLPRWIAYFKEDPRRLPDNRNLTIYAGLALHEAGHLVGGTYALDWKPLLLNQEDPVLAHAIFNTVEDHRIERYLCQIARHPQVTDLIAATNLFLFRHPSYSPVFDFLFIGTSRVEGTWSTACARNPDHLLAWEKLKASDLPTGPHRDMEAFNDWFAASLSSLNCRDPAKAMRIALSTYEILKLWPRPPLEGDQRTAGRSKTKDPNAAAAGTPRPMADEKDLEALADAFEEDPEGCMRSLGIDPEALESDGAPSPQPTVQSLGSIEGTSGADGGAMSPQGDAPGLGEAGDTPSSPSASAVPGNASDGEVSPSSNRTEGIAGGDDLADQASAPTASPALERIIEATMRAGAMAAFRKPGEVAEAHYTTNDATIARRQKATETRQGEKTLVSPGERRKRASEERKAQVPRSRIVKASGSSRKSELFRVCREQKISAVSRDFLAENKRYDGFAHRLGHMLSRSMEDAQETKLDFSASDGDIDDERLIEVLTDPRRPDPVFFEFLEEEEKSLSVIIGFDISGSTAGRVSGKAKLRPRVIDIEKHFALIFARALRIITDDVAVLAFNSIGGTTIYRPEPLEALSSLDADGSNRDGDFIRYCAADLAEKARDLKYLFLISDGMPSASGYSGLSALDDTVLAFREARKDGIRVVYLNIDSGDLEYFDRFAREVVWAKRFRHPEELIKAAPELARRIAREAL